MTHARRVRSLILSGLASLVLTLVVTTCGGGSGSGSSGTPTSPSASGSATNSGMVAGSGTCQYSATPTAFDVAHPGQGGDSFGVPPDCTNISCLLEIPVTVTGLAADGERCTWWAESKTNTSEWISIEGAMTASGPIDANIDSVVVPANGTLQFSLADEEQPSQLAIDCTTFGAPDYNMNPVETHFDYAGGTGDTITIDVAAPKTREGAILIREEGSNILLFTIPVVQHGSVCSWYLKAANCAYVPDGNCADPVTPATPASDWIFITSVWTPDSMSATTLDWAWEGSGSASFLVESGDVPAGTPAPRDGVIALYGESDDEIKGWLYVNQLGAPTEDDPTEDDPPEDEVPECTYNYAISQSEFYGFVGGTAELTVTISDATCGWRAEGSTASEEWISVGYNNLMCPGDVCYGTQTVQVVVQDGNVGSPPMLGLEGRSGEVIIYKKVEETFESLFTVPITQFRQDP